MNLIVVFSIQKAIKSRWLARPPFSCAIAQWCAVRSTIWEVAQIFSVKKGAIAHCTLLPKYREQVGKPKKLHLYINGYEPDHLLFIINIIKKIWIANKAGNIFDRELDIFNFFKCNAGASEVILRPEDRIWLGLNSSTT